MKRVRSIYAVMILCMIVLLGCTSFSTEVSAKAKINKKKVTIYVGKTVSLKVKNNKKKVKWSSTNKSVATVSTKGKVKAKKVGKATIIAKVGKKKYRCRITVKNKIVKNKTEKKDEVIYSVKIENGLDVSASYDRTIVKIYNYGNKNIYVGNPKADADYISAYNILAGSEIYQSNRVGVFPINPCEVEPYGNRHMYTYFDFSRAWTDKDLYSYYKTFHLTNATYFEVPIYSYDGKLHIERGYVNN